jgi:hypothetical protein
MGKASRKKRERKENKPVAVINGVPHFEVHAGLATASSAVRPEENKENS